MNTALKVLTSAFLISSLGACSGNTSKSGDELEQIAPPEWLENPPQKMNFAYGIGSGDIWGDKADAVRRAGDSARVNLVSQLKVTVSGDFSSTVQERKATGEQTELVQTVQNTIRSQVPPVELDEVIIIDTFFEKKFVYALAELDRIKAAARIKGQISELEQQIIALHDKPRSGSTLQKLRVLLPALKLFAKREGLADQLALVSMERQKPALSAKLEGINDAIYTLFNQLQVRINMTNSGAKEITAGVVEALTEQGMRISEQGSYDLLLDVSATLRPVEKQGSHFVFADSRVTIKDSNNRTLSTFSKQAKGVSGYPKLAQTKAEQSVAKMLANELASALVDRID